MVTGPLIAAIGNFDGVHRGHQFVMERTATIAREPGARAGAVVFDPHPRRFFRPDDPPFLITTPASRNAHLLASGADVVIPLVFDAELAALTPEAFVRDILKDKLGLAGVVVGRDFRFGKGRAGDAAGLEDLCAAHGLASFVLDPVGGTSNAEKFGSTAIREAIRAGAVDRAGGMLGRLWSVSGVVEEGRRLGRTLGFPTANMALGDIIEPRRGVYAVRADIEGRSINGVANFGRKPTVGSDAPLLEVHLFDFSGDLYGKSIEVGFFQFIRDEMKFDGLDSLKAQIAIDSGAARRILKN